MTLPISHPLLQPVQRWTSISEVLDAIAAGQVGRDQIRRVHGIGIAELDSWIAKRAAAVRA